MTSVGLLHLTFTYFCAALCVNVLILNVSKQRERVESPSVKKIHSLPAYQQFSHFSAEYPKADIDLRQACTQRFAAVAYTSSKCGSENMTVFGSIKEGVKGGKVPQGYSDSYQDVKNAMTGINKDCEKFLGLTRMEEARCGKSEGVIRKRMNQCKAIMGGCSACDCGAFLRRFGSHLKPVLETS